jgi:hypothetical protein
MTYHECMLTQTSRGGAEDSTSVKCWFSIIPVSLQEGHKEQALDLVQSMTYLQSDCSYIRAEEASR